MLYNNFKECKISRLGFGLMRLPVNSDGTINKKETEKMIDYAIAHGVNYFDTAWPYHGGMSEIICSQILNKYPRDSYFLATKFPGHQIISNMNVQEIFEEQLKKCNTTYFDFYLLHNVYEGSIDRYLDKELNIIPYLIEQKKKGRIKHLGFSSHGDLDIIKRIIDLYPNDLEFCQLQINYVDWTLQKAKEKYDYITSLGLGVWVMETVRGGKLATLDSEFRDKLKARRKDESIPSWALRFILKLENVKVMLSGMSSYEQMIDNIKTMENDKPLTDEEFIFLIELGKELSYGIPCTSCKYCTSGCPKGLNIPRLLSFYNDLKYQKNIINVSMKIEALEKEKQPSACISCKKCTTICPQKIDIPKYLHLLADEIERMPKWLDVCKQREEANKKAKLD
ncbi:MAG: aldo/keto reductase [Bacilli bacterium]|nr:aldo/keto reductase [Bacilli bacterium]